MGDAFYWFFIFQASFVMVFFTVMACIPILYNTMRLEESKDMKIKKEIDLIKQHNKAIFFLLFLFLGITLSCVLWYAVLPSDTISYLFDKQTKTIIEINNQISGKTIQLNLLSKIFFNNMRVLALAILFSFIYGAGAIFILTWNATVIGTAIGNFIRSGIASATHAGYFQVISVGLLKYSIHGIPEIMAYFYGGLAGGIISVAVIRHHYRSKNFAHIVADSADLIMISIGFLLLAAFFEVYLTPLLF